MPPRGAHRRRVVGGRGPHRHACQPWARCTGYDAMANGPHTPPHSYDLTQVSIKFDQPLFGKGIEECPGDYVFAAQWGDKSYCCPRGASLEWVHPQGPTCVSASGSTSPKEMVFNATDTFDFTNKPFLRWMQTDLAERMAVQCGDRPPSKPSSMHEGPPPYLLLPSVSDDALSAFFEVRAGSGLPTPPPPPFAAPSSPRSLLLEPTPARFVATGDGRPRDALEAAAAPPG